MSTRLKLIITEVKEPRPVGQAEVLDFLAHTEADTKTARYSVWSRTFYEYIKKDTSIDCDVETKVSDKNDPDGNPYVSRKITQIYVDGKSVGGQKSQWQPRGDSPEQRASIETQVAAKIIAELRIAEKLPENSPEYKAMLAWCRVKLSVKAESKVTKPDIAQAEKDIVETITGEIIEQPAEMEAPPIVPDKSTLRATKEESGGIAPTVEMAGFVNMTELNDSLKTLQDKGIRAYSNKTILSYLNAITRSKCETIPEAVAKLEKGQAEEFTKRVQDAIDCS